MKHFPIFISLENKEIVIIGAGNIAARRMAAVLPFGAGITVIAPELGEQMEELCDAYRQKGHITVWKRAYKKGDVKAADAFLLLACSNDGTTNEEAVKEAREIGILANRCDKKEDCDFYFPGIACEGEIVAGVTAGGSNHRLAKQVTERIREVLQEEFQEENAGARKECGHGE